MENLSFWVWTFSIVGFLIAAYSIVANDAIQTLGTFLSSNAQRPWWVLWAYASSIIVAVMLTGYFFYDTDIAFDRLNSIPYPENGVQWYHAVPPIFLLILTRYGIPVSTTFLVLTIFALTGGDSTDEPLWPAGQSCPDGRDCHGSYRGHAEHRAVCCDAGCQSTGDGIRARRQR